MLPIVTPAEMAEIDAAAPEPIDVLIDRAARRVARAARQMLGGVYGRRVVAVAGPGNNGADARVAARLLQRQGVRVQVVGPLDDVAPCDLIIDGAFGTGLRRPYDPPHPARPTPVLAVDIPSGIDGLTGHARGAPRVAQRTVTFAALKPGLLLGDAPPIVGDIEVADIGLDVSRARSWLFTRSDAVAAFRPRGHDAHKWQRAVLVIGGSPGMSGAPRFASDAALRSGAGLVRCLLPGGVAPADRSEVVHEAIPATDWARQALDQITRFAAVAIGPGLDPSARDDVRFFLEHTPATLPIVIDGTALRMLDGLALRPSMVLTPHDGEHVALTGDAPSADRFAAAREIAASRSATVLLKGPVTIVATPDGRCLASAHGDPRLATAGSGDVLTGIIAAAASAGCDPLTAAAFGAWVHADAARRGPLAGVVASDLVRGLAHSLSDLAATGGHHATH